MRKKVRKKVKIYLDMKEKLRKYFDIKCNLKSYIDAIFMVTNGSYSYKIFMKFGWTDLIFIVQYKYMANNPERLMDYSDLIYLLEKSNLINEFNEEVDLFVEKVQTKLEEEILKEL